MKLKLTADKVKVNGPKVDGGFSITFEIGEYQQAQISEVLLITQNETIDLTIEQKSEKSD